MLRLADSHCELSSNETSNIKHQTFEHMQDLRDQTN
jgi:hypothetical protein